VLDAGRAAHWFLVRLELNRIPGDKSSREPELAHGLDEQPGKVSARAMAALERFFGSENSRLHADVVAESALDQPVQVH